MVKGLLHSLRIQADHNQPEYANYTFDSDKTFPASTVTLTLLTPAAPLGTTHKSIDGHSEQQHDTFNHLFHVRSLAL